MKSSILVVGGTGKTGRRVAAQLNARGVEVRIGSRSADPPFDWQDQKTWPLALRDVASAYVSYYPDLSVPGAAETVKAFAELAVKSGVKRLVLLSGRGEPGAELAEQGPRLGRLLDDPAVQLVQPELQRGRLPGAGDER